MPLSAVQPDQYDSLLAEKVGRVTKLLAPYSAPTPEIFSSDSTGFRLRAEFRMWHDGDDLSYVMFRRDEPKTPVPINAFPIAHASIQSLMPTLLTHLRESQALRRKLFQVEFLATLSGQMLVTLIYHRKLDEDWETAAAALVNALQPTQQPLSLIGRSRRQKIVIGRDYVLEELTLLGRNYRYRQYEQSFTQPNGVINSRMIEWACGQAASCPGDLLELYCGNGNFTLPLAHCFDHVIATELSKTSVRAARANLADNDIGNAHILRMSAEEVAQAMAGVREFRRVAELPRPLQEYDLQTVLVDPPRAGLDEHTLNMAAGFRNILYISCNPHTLAANLDSLCQTHTLTGFALFDQFPYTDHMECGVALMRNT